MRQQLSIYKFKKIAAESFKNGLRLHFDSILLYNNKSFPSAFQLSVLALEEFSKSDWVEHYYYSSITNEGLAPKEIEQEWLNLLYFHPRKQQFFLRWYGSSDFSPKFVKLIESGELEKKKQKATYVGLRKERKLIDVNGKISLPNHIKEKDARQMISVLSEFLKDCCDRKDYYSYRFEIEERDKLITKELKLELKKWRHRSGLRRIPSFMKKVRKAAANIT